MRSARLLALLLRLQRTGPATAATLAAELEVSERTIYRDVSLLQAAGVPLWTEPGAGGGIRLVEGWRSPVDGFTASETVALTLGSTGAADLGLGAVLTAARSKLRSALPEPARGELERVDGRFLLDAPGWFHDGDRSDHLATVSGAVWDGIRLDVRYGTRRPAARRLDPLGLVLKAGTWYLVAAHRRQPRTYRVSRITAATPRPAEPAWRPRGFDLAAWWDASAAEFDASIRPLQARLRLASGALRQLVRVVPGPVTRAAVTAARPVDGDRVEVDLPLEPLEVALTQLSGVPGVEVVAPGELRAALAARGRELARRNA
ncbi:MAG TPA: WYL domain-containing protein [Acidimicrobiales bacterium]|nr:WYL domain-containing protein [Acidimicrobiales bacterium]